MAFLPSRVGSRQSPTFEPSARPHCPLASAPALMLAFAQVVRPKQLAFFSQMRPVCMSFTVPLLVPRPVVPQSTKRLVPKLSKQVSKPEEHTSELHSLRHIVCRLVLGGMRFP